MVLSKINDNSGDYLVKYFLQPEKELKGKRELKGYARPLGGTLYLIKYFFDRAFSHFFLAREAKSAYN
jgi:hypothetical protein